MRAAASRIASTVAVERAWTGVFRGFGGRFGIMVKCEF
jgi:hypothetical protein